MNTIYRKKFIGTSLLASLLIGAFLVASGSVYAQFISTPGGNVIVEGIVSAADSDSVTVNTNGTPPIEFVHLDQGTTVTGGPIDPGDAVRIIARRSGNTLTARVVNVDGPGTAYGTTGDNVIVSDATVVAKTANSFTVESNGIQTTLQVNGSTHFVRTTFASLAVGDNVRVMGEDSGSAFVARTVIK